jgi:uncharacterized protein YukE
VARVVTSEAAVQLIARLQTDVDVVRESLDAMLRTGDQLAMPQVWEGTAANRFRDTEWAETQRWAATSVQQLTELRAAVDQVNQAILQAGGGLG